MSDFRPERPRGLVAGAAWLLALLSAGAGWCAGEPIQRFVGIVGVIPGLEPVPGTRSSQPSFPATEVGFQAVLAQIARLREEALRTRMLLERQEVALRAGLLGEAQDSLKAAAEEAIQASLAEWISKVTPFVRDSFFDWDSEFSLPDLATCEIISDYRFPTEQTAWIEALQKAFSPAQAKAWEQFDLGRHQDATALFETALQPQLERTRALVENRFLVEAAQIPRHLDLEPGRAEKLVALAHTATAVYLTAWRKRAERVILGQARDQKREVSEVEFGDHFLPLEDPRERRGAWEAGLAAVLNPEERARWQALLEEHRSRWLGVMARALLANLEPGIVFSSSQRAQLQPLIERRLQAAALTFDQPDDAPAPVDRFESFNAVALRITDAELARILDAAQRAHWKERLTGVNLDRIGNLAGLLPAPAVEEPAAVPEPVAEPEPEEREHVLSDFLQAKSEEERGNNLKEMQLLIDDATRSAALPAETVARLRSAARGATEASLVEWRRGSEDRMHQFLDASFSPDLRAQLAGLQEIPWSGGHEGPPLPEQRVWKAALTHELSEIQRAVWKAEIDAREAFRLRIGVPAMLAEFDRRYLLTSAQWGALSAAVEKLLQKSVSVSGPNFVTEDSWYLQGGSRFLPLAGVPEKELREILSPEQLTQWKKSPEAAEGAAFWSGIELAHAR